MAQPTHTDTLKDPRKEVVDFDLLQAAYSAQPTTLYAEYRWNTMLRPFMPSMMVSRYEFLYQLAPFLLPLIVIGLSWYQWSGALFWGIPTFLFWALPVALRLGYLLDKCYQKYLRHLNRMAQAMDCGRYEAVRLISQRTVLRPQDVTLELIRKMARQYQAEKDRRDQEALKLQAAKAKPAARYSAASAGAAAVATSTASYADTYATPDSSDDDDFWNGSSFYDDAPQVNPASGLPMIPGGGPLDVAGNVYGTDGY